MKLEPEARMALVTAMVELERTGLNHGTSGNVSVRVDGGLLVSPSAVPPAQLSPVDVVALGDDGAVLGSNRQRPTSEWRIHVDVLAARPDVGAVVHTHSTEATALACLRRRIPAVHYEVGLAGGATIPCADYATFGTPELSTNVLAALDGHDACLMANHGVLAVGPDLAAAMALAVEVEWLAAVYRRAVASGEPVVLPDGEMRRVVSAYVDYRSRS